MNIFRKTLALCFWNIYIIDVSGNDATRKQKRTKK